MATHTCVFYDDGEPELLCVCGSRAVAVLDAHGETVVLVELHEDATVPALPSTAPARSRVLAITA